MESNQRESMKKIRRNSKTLLQDLIYRGVHGGDRDTPVPAQTGRDTKMIHSIASLIRAKSRLLLLESPDTVEIYKLDEPTARPPRAGTDDLYLPPIPTKASSLNSIKRALSQSCPYLYDKRRGSLSSVASQRTGNQTKKQSNLKAQREAKKSNVAVTMTYLGQGHRGSRSESAQDELKVLQQVNGGENICVFKGLVSPGERFQFVSQRHRGYPFSATMYVNGMMVARISSCCEYRYAPGFQQGRKSCFRLTWLAGGVPCYRCTSLRNKYSSCQQLNNGTKEDFIFPLEQSPGRGTAESCPSSPLFFPAKPENKSVRRTRKQTQNWGGVGGASTDSDEPNVAGIKDASKKKRRKGQSNQRESKSKTTGSNKREQGPDAKGSEGSQRSAEEHKCEDREVSTRHETKLQKTTGNGPAPQVEQQQHRQQQERQQHQQEQQPQQHQQQQQQPQQHQQQQPRQQQEQQQQQHQQQLQQRQQHQQHQPRQQQEQQQQQHQQQQQQQQQHQQQQQQRQQHQQQQPRQQQEQQQQQHQQQQQQRQQHQQQQQQQQHQQQQPQQQQQRQQQQRQRQQKHHQQQQQQLNKTRKVLDSLQDEEALTKQNGEKQKDPGSNGKIRDGERLKDFQKECVETSTVLDQSPNKHKWFKANMLERYRLQKTLSSCPKTPGSDVELSTESDTVVQPDEEPEKEEDTASEDAGKEEPDKEQDLQAQLDAMITVLKTSDEVEQLVLRNTDLTDDHLLSLAKALKSSPSEVTMLNLNLNLIGPYGSHILLDVLKVKPQVKGLHLFGNKLRDHGLLTLLNGIAELQEQTATTAAAIQQAMLFPSEQNMFLQQALANLPCGWSSFRVFALVELDVGGNGLGSEGVKLLASYMRHHSYLQYLGLAQTSGADLAAWKELFESLKENRSLNQIILDENNLGDPGVRLLADVLNVNMMLQQVDLDRNDISDVGGNDIMGALLCRTQFPLRHLSLKENYISTGLMNRIQEEVKPN